MRIVIDMQGAQSQSRFRGIGRYSLNLAQAIVRNAGNHEVWLVLNGALSDTIEPLREAFSGIIPHDRIQIFNIPTPTFGREKENDWRSKAAELIRESFLEELSPDLILVTSLFEGFEENVVVSVGSLTPSLPTAVIYYDLIPLLNKEIYLHDENLSRWYSKKVESLKKCSILLSISEYSRQEALSQLMLLEDQVVNISAATQDYFAPLSRDDVKRKEDVCRRYGIDRPYIMSNGAIEPRKNIERLIEAFSILPANIRTKYNLLIVGRVTESDRIRLERMASRFGIQNHLVLPGYVPDDDLVVLYNFCDLFVFPSLHEGFGLPPLEAMACGAPVIGSDLTSIPEVIGCASALFDSKQPQKIAEKILQVLTDQEFSQSLRMHGLEQAKKFSWDESARRALQAFEKLAKHPTAPRKSWRAVTIERANSYQTLINALVAIPKNQSSPLDSDLMMAAIIIDHNRRQTDRSTRASLLPKSIVWRIEGPFDSSYSLSLLNREMARALVKLNHIVVLHSTEGPGDFFPDKAFLGSNPDLEQMHLQAQRISQEDADIVIRNLYPPRVEDMLAKLNFLHSYAWEESGIPQEWIDSFNEHLQGVTALSKHVQKILIDHGLVVPLSVSGCGVDHWERIIPNPNFKITAKSFKFLHVSSCFPRKGADVLLEAYGRAFKNSDDVTLIIKTFPNPHNTIRFLLDNVRNNQDDFPDVVILEENMSDADLKALYERSDVLVAPSRAEGFGLPIAEAMLSKIPVVSTAWGGQLDFCNEKTSWLIDYTFGRTKTHFGLFDSVWAEPDADHLMKIMLEIYKLPPEKRRERSLIGRDLILKEFSWEKAASRLVDSAQDWSLIPKTPSPHIGWISTWNTKCGIAEYSSRLIETVPGRVTIFAPIADEILEPDTPNVLRCWRINHDKLDVLDDQVKKNNIDTLVIQFNYGFFSFDNLGSFLNEQINSGLIVVIELHSTRDPVHLSDKKLEKLKIPLSRCHRILVHSINDLNRLKKIGLVDNVTLFPHGILDYSPVLSSNTDALSSGSWKIASYGFFLPNKGLMELVDAVFLLRQNGLNISLKMVNAEYPDPDSTRLIREAIQKIQDLGLSDDVQMVTDFLSDTESLALLSEANIIVYPYQSTGESASGAVRHGIATGRLVAVTPLEIFDDVSSAVYYLPGQTPEKIAEGIRTLLREIALESEFIARIKNEADQWRNAHRYSHLGRRFYGILQALGMRKQDFENSNI